MGQRSVLNVLVYQDDMGLGKTYQALACAACYADEWCFAEGAPLLLILPKSLRRQVTYL